MNLLYITADFIGGPGGGSTVTAHESEAIKELGPCAVWGRRELEQWQVKANAYHAAKGHKTPNWGDDPWMWDSLASSKVVEDCISVAKMMPFPKLCHLYAGTFGGTIKLLQVNGCKVS